MRSNILRRRMAWFLEGLLYAENNGISIQFDASNQSRTPLLSVLDILAYLSQNNEKYIPEIHDELLSEPGLVSLLLLSRRMGIQLLPVRDILVSDNLKSMLTYFKENDPIYRFSAHQSSTLWDKMKHVLLYLESYKIPVNSASCSMLNESHSALLTVLDYLRKNKIIIDSKTYEKLIETNSIQLATLYSLTQENESNIDQDTFENLCAPERHSAILSDTFLLLKEHKTLVTMDLYRKLIQKDSKKLIVFDHMIRLRESGNADLYRRLLDDDELCNVLADLINQKVISSPIAVIANDVNFINMLKLFKKAEKEFTTPRTLRLIMGVSEQVKPFETIVNHLTSQGVGLDETDYILILENIKVLHTSVLRTYPVHTQNNHHFFRCAIPYVCGHHFLDNSESVIALPPKQIMRILRQKRHQLEMKAAPELNSTEGMSVVRRFDAVRGGYYDHYSLDDNGIDAIQALIHALRDDLAQQEYLIRSKEIEYKDKLMLHIQNVLESGQLSNNKHEAILKSLFSGPEADTKLKKDLCGLILHEVMKVQIRQLSLSAKGKTELQKSWEIDTFLATVFILLDPSAITSMFQFDDEGEINCLSAFADQMFSDQYRYPRQHPYHESCERDDLRYRCNSLKEACKLLARQKKKEFMFSMNRKNEPSRAANHRAIAIVEELANGSSGKLIWEWSSHIAEVFGIGGRVVCLKYLNGRTKNLGLSKQRWKDHNLIVSTSSFRRARGLNPRKVIAGISEKEIFKAAIILDALDKQAVLKRVKQYAGYDEKPLAEKIFIIREEYERVRQCTQDSMTQYNTTYKSSCHHENGWGAMMNSLIAYHKTLIASLPEVNNQSSVSRHSDLKKIMGWESREDCPMPVKAYTVTFHSI